ncbi:MAG: hypothetical protein M5U26_21815 [Planctomycetota bacterium]|nr:hypothetical protein [Planctomycetota bacterium]
MPKKAALATAGDATPADRLSLIKFRHASMRKEQDPIRADLEAEADMEEVEEAEADLDESEEEAPETEEKDDEAGEDEEEL